MSESSPDMGGVLESAIDNWLSDPDSSVEYSELVEGRWAVRMRQQVREATTVWFRVGERSLSYEAYVLPVSDDRGAAFRQALRRNHRAWRVFFALDGEGGLLLRGRLPAVRVTVEELDLVLGEIYDTVEVSFRPLLGAAYSDREKSG